MIINPRIWWCWTHWHWTIDIALSTVTITTLPAAASALPNKWILWAPVWLFTVLFTISPYIRFTFPTWNCFVVTVFEYCFLKHIIARSLCSLFHTLWKKVPILRHRILYPSLHVCVYLYLFLRTYVSLTYLYNEAKDTCR